jgi:hypothetical protein
LTLATWVPLLRICLLFLLQYVLLLLLLSLLLLCLHILCHPPHLLAAVSLGGKVQGLPCLGPPSCSKQRQVIRARCF